METNPARPEPEVEEAFDRLVAEGVERLERPVPAMISTGLLGGIDVGFGVLAYLIVKEHTGDTLLAGIAFSIGFVALLLARSELFTENFMVPVVAVVARSGTMARLGRLWLITFVTNVLGGAVITLMTRMQHATQNLGIQIVPAILFGSLLAGGELFHCVLDALFMMGAMFAGADFGVGTAAVAIGWALLGNMVGGVGLVTGLRLLRVPQRVRDARNATT